MKEVPEWAFYTPELSEKYGYPDSEWYFDDYFSVCQSNKTMCDEPVPELDLSDLSYDDLENAAKGAAAAGASLLLLFILLPIIICICICVCCCKCNKVLCFAEPEAPAVEMDEKPTQPAPQQPPQMMAPAMGAPMMPPPMHHPGMMGPPPMMGGMGMPMGAHHTSSSTTTTTTTTAGGMM